MSQIHFPTHWAALPEVVSELYAQRHEPPAAFYSAIDRDRALANLTAPRVDAGVAVLPIRGELTKAARFGPLGMLDYEVALRKLAVRPDVDAIVLAIDSPGGTVDGTPRLAGVVRQVAQQKPVVAFADGLMASAAYWIGAQASAIIAAPFAVIGSIGTLLVHTDFSVMLEKAGIRVTMLTAPASTEKTEGNPFEPLPKEVKAKLTAELGRINDAFIGAVRAQRPNIPTSAFTGAAWTVEAAPRGFADRVGQLETAIATAALLALKRAPRDGRPRTSLADTRSPSTPPPQDRDAFQAHIRWRAVVDRRSRGGLCF